RARRAHRLGGKRGRLWHMCSHRCDRFNCAVSLGGAVQQRCRRTATRWPLSTHRRSLLRFRRRGPSYVLRLPRGWSDALAIHRWLAAVSDRGRWWLGSCPHLRRWVTGLVCFDRILRRDFRHRERPRHWKRSLATGANALDRQLRGGWLMRSHRTFVLLFTL